MIKTDRKDGTLIIKVQGRVDGTNANDFQNKIKASVTDEDKAVLLDMAALSYISSAGLRVVLMVAKALEQRGANFMIYSLTDAIREVFEISGFDKVIKVYRNKAQALASLKG